MIPLFYLNSHTIEKLYKNYQQKETKQTFKDFVKEFTTLADLSTGEAVRLLEEVEKSWEHK